MTLTHVIGLALIALGWVAIVLVMRATWPAVRAFLRDAFAPRPYDGHDKICGGKCPRCGGPP